MSFRYKLRVPASGALQFPTAGQRDVRHLAAQAESVQSAARLAGAAGEDVDEAVVAFTTTGWRGYVREELRLATRARARAA